MGDTGYVMEESDTPGNKELSRSGHVYGETVGLLRNGCSIALWVEKQLFPMLCGEREDEARKSVLKVTALGLEDMEEHRAKTDSGGR